MKFFSTLVVTAFFTISALAQQNTTGSDDSIQAFAAGGSLFVPLGPTSNDGGINVVYIIGLRPCPDGSCIAPEQGMGMVIAAGVHGGTPNDTRLVTIPSDAKPGPAYISVASIGVKGESDAVPGLDITGITINIVANGTRGTSKAVRSLKLKY